MEKELQIVKSGILIGMKTTNVSTTITNLITICPLVQ